MYVTHLAEVDAAAVHDVDQAAGSRHQEVAATLQLAQLHRAGTTQISKCILNLRGRHNPDFKVYFKSQERNTSS